MRKRILSVITVFCFLFSVFLWWQNFLLPVDKNNKKTKILIIRNREGVKVIAGNLKKEGLIKDSFLFQVLVQKLGIAKSIQAGDFWLSPSMEAKKIAQELTHGTLDIWLTIPEGLRVEEIANIINSKFQIPNSKFCKEAKNYEGNLFPDTYLIPKNADSKLIVKIMTDNFNKKVASQVDLEKARKKELNFNGLTFDESIILASIIEREAKFNADRLRVASVLYNRLKMGMKLDVDATVQYAKANTSCLPGEKCDYWPKHLSSEDLTINSPYNTYISAGLPPAPICNPGLDSIKAVLSPEVTEFWYYLSDKKGRIHYAKTLEEQNENIENYLN